jgi:hypothetical protein
MEALLKSYRAKFTDFLLNYLSSWFIFIFEFGAIFESLMNGSLLMLYNKIMYGKGQLIFEWNYKVIRGWSYVLTSIIFLFATIIGILR